MRQRFSRQTLRRALAGAYAGILAAGLLSPINVKASPLDICRGDDPATGSPYYLSHAVECAGVCYIEIDPKKTPAQFASACADCTVIAAGMSAMGRVASTAASVVAAPGQVVSGALTGGLEGAKEAVESTSKSVYQSLVSASQATGDVQLVSGGLIAFTTYACGTGAVDLAKQAAEEATCNKGPRGCCIYVEKSGDGRTGKIEREQCRGEKVPLYYGDCYCIVDKAVVPPDENKRGRSTYKSCEIDCELKKGRVDVTQGIGRYKAESEGAPQLEVEINPLCYKPDDCALDDGVFVGLDSACPAGQGKCKAKEPTVNLSLPIMGQTTITGIRSFILLMLRFAVAAAMVACALMFVYGGFKYILNSGFVQIAGAKETMVNGLVGMMLVLGSVALLNTVNPATTSYDQLQIYKVNKIQFSMFNWCPDYKPARPGTQLKFGDSGDPPGQFLNTEVKYDTDGQDTKCGKEYYIEGVVGDRCKGRKCEDKGKACFPCTSGGDIEECGERETGFACVPSTIGGTLRFADGRAPKNIQVMAVCNWIQAAPDKFGYSTAVKDKVPTFHKADFSGQTSGPAGSVVYTWAASSADIAKLKADCQQHGGLRGVLLGVVYKDTEESRGSSAAIGAGTSMFLGVGPLGGAVIGAAAGGTIDDVLVVGKTDCGNPGTRNFSAYIDGWTSDKDDMKAALYCGGWIVPGSGGVSPNMTPLITAASIWTPEELEASLRGDKPIVCDLTLSKKNAPSDPSKKLMSGCDVNWCPPISPKCNEK